MADTRLMENLLDSIKRKNVVLFVGAGVSMNLGLLSWKGLISKMAEDLGFEPEQFSTLGDYLALAEYPDFTRVMRRLVEIDPDNKIDYLQALLLTQIEASNDTSRQAPDATAQLREWLDQLRKVGGDAVSTEFEAGVLDLAGFREQALVSYRRALALHPERADDHLLLADILRQAGRQLEAETSLQYLAESAESDELFLVAVDGITNMQTGNAATIKWAQRRALERLTSRDDKLYLYEMLGELAEEARDPNAYIAALEGSLAHADSRRSYVLRELLAVTAEVTVNDGSQRVIGPDPNKNVAYARRLIALGEEMPPEVYVDLGRTFIRLNDPASARRAFSLAVDRTGRTSIVFDSGIRRGQDVFRALALGANVVAVGRPVMYGLALGGHLGVQSVLEYLRNDLYIVMQLAGTPNVKAITRDYIAPRIA